MDPQVGGVDDSSTTAGLLPGGVAAQQPEDQAEAGDFEYHFLAPPKKKCKQLNGESKAKAGQLRKLTWDKKLQLLRDYKEKHGNCDVPPNYLTPCGIALGNCVENLRNQCSRYQSKCPSTMTPKRIADLEAVGLYFGKTQKDKWENHYQNLHAFYQEFGHTRVPQRYKTADGSTLGEWVKKQRCESCARTSKASSESSRYSPDSSLEHTAGRKLGNSKRASTPKFHRDALIV